MAACELVMFFIAVPQTIYEYIYLTLLAVLEKTGLLDYKKLGLYEKNEQPLP